ncbi:AEC family transporter [Streptomyces sp. NPDC051041]|uniref:AEC family transporter n=1 Tax=Streptomyces sp. NPDC051041 TaxID=3365640 RepID=UPI0037A966A3
MEFDTILNAIVPLFAIVAVGYVASAFRVFQGNTAQAVNDFVFYIALPALLFLSVATADISAGVPWQFIAVAILSIVFSYALGMAGARLLFRRDSRKSLTVGLLSGYGNVAYMGVPLLLAVLGPKAVLPAAIGQLVHNMFNMVCYPAAHTVLSARSTGPGAMHRTESRAQLRRDISRKVVLNPVALSVAVGLVFAVLHVDLPAPVHTTVDMVGDAAAPGALFAVGLTLRKAVAGMRDGSVGTSEVGLTVAIKLAVMPVFAYLLVHTVFGMPDTWAAASVILAGLPNAATAYVLAQQARTHVQEAAAGVVVSTAGALVTLSLLIPLVKP